MLAMRGIEVGAAVVIIAFGTLLLTGYMASESDRCGILCGADCPGLASSDRACR